MISNLEDVDNPETVNVLLSNFLTYSFSGKTSAPRTFGERKISSGGVTPPTSVPKIFKRLVISYPRPPLVTLILTIPPKPSLEISNIALVPEPTIVSASKLEYTTFACAGIIVFATALTVNERSLAGVAPPIYVPAIDTVSPTAYPLPPDLKTIDVDIALPVPES